MIDPIGDGMGGIVRKIVYVFPVAVLVFLNQRGKGRWTDLCRNAFEGVYGTCDLVSASDFLVNLLVDSW